MVGIDVVSAAIQHIFTPTVFVLIVLAVVYGVIFGVIPGLGPPLAVTLLIPFSLVLDPATAISLMGAAFVSSVYGGSISAILLNVPGEPTSVATTFDGYPLTTKGRAGYALGASVTSSVIGGILSMIVLIAVAPLLADFAIQFGATEFFALGIFGLTVIAGVSRGSLVKGGIAAVIGLLLATVGYSPTQGVIRFDFGISYLSSGLAIVPIAVGLFAVSEAIMMIDQGGQISEADEDGGGDEGGPTEFDSLVPGVRAALSRPVTLLRSSAIGIGFGLIPGMGGAVANFVSYFAAESSDKVDSGFGTGVIEGVMAPEAANNAVTGSALVPTLILGIPGSVTMAIFLAGLLFNDVQYGPLAFVETPVLVYTLFAAMILANIVMFFVGFGTSSRLVFLTKLPMELIAPVVIIMSVLGTFALNLTPMDAVFTMIVGVGAYVLRKIQVPPVNIIFGFVLGPIIETNFQQAMARSGGDPAVLLNGWIPTVLYLVSLVVLINAASKAVTGRSVSISQLFGSGN